MGSIFYRIKMAHCFFRILWNTEINGKYFFVGALGGVAENVKAFGVGIAQGTLFIGFKEGEWQQFGQLPKPFFALPQGFFRHDPFRKIAADSEQNRFIVPDTFCYFCFDGYEVSGTGF